MSDRGMKKWNAYKSLPEHDPAVRSQMSNKYKVAKPLISSDEAELINEILVNYHGEKLKISYYRNGTINVIESTLTKIDPYNRKLILPDRSSINLNELVGLARAY